MSDNGFALGKVDADAVEDIVGLCSSSLQGEVNFCAFSGADLRPLWGIGKFALNAAHTVTVVVAGVHALLMDPAALVHIVALADGKELGNMQLADRATETCTPSEHPGVVWVRLADRSELLLDPTRRSSTPTPRPASCRSTESGMVTMCMASGGAGRAPMHDCESMPLPPPLPDMLPFVVSYDGATGALLGAHSPGTGYPMLAAFNVAAGGSTLRFKRPVAEGSPLADTSTDTSGPMKLAGGRIVAKQGSEIVAFDATTGKRLWSAAPGSFSTLHLSAARAYVGRWSELAIYDAASGARVGQIGSR
ncbi:MAG: hypothetical protein EXR75_07240 [Myxococcales bacterium]|nr:hypothetical protein [Myxococcales bacterium]